MLGKKKGVDTVSKWTVTQATNNAIFCQQLRTTLMTISDPEDRKSSNATTYFRIENIFCWTLRDDDLNVKQQQQEREVYFFFFGDATFLLYEIQQTWLFLVWVAFVLLLTVVVF